MINPKDNTATTFDDIEAGDTVSLASTSGEEVGEITARQAVPFGHKLALAIIGKGDKVLKYGEVIGLTTIEEKSLGAFAKTGTASLQGVLEYAERPQGKGLFFMDGSAMTGELIGGDAAAGVQIHIYNLGGGLTSSFRCLPGWAGGLPILPEIVGVTNPSKPRDSQEKECFDIYADTIIEGKESIAQVADRLFQEVIAVASGKLTKQKMRSGYRELLEMYTTGPIL